MKFTWPSYDQFRAATRHLGTSVGTAVGIFGLLGILDSDQQQLIISYANELADGLNHVFHGASGIIAILWPIAVAYFGRGAAIAQSLPHVVSAVVDHPDVEIGDGKLIVPPQVATAVAKAQVVSK